MWQKLGQTPQKLIMKRRKRRRVVMINDTVQGAIYLSIIDMILLVVFLYLMGQLFKLFPIVNKIKFFRKKGH
jgi:hypothetical protein